MSVSAADVTSVNMCRHSELVSLLIETAAKMLHYHCQCMWFGVLEQYAFLYGLHHVAFISHGMFLKILLLSLLHSVGSHTHKSINLFTKVRCVGSHLDS